MAEKNDKPNLVKTQTNKMFLEYPQFVKTGEASIDAIIAFRDEFEEYALSVDKKIERYTSKESVELAKERFSELLEKKKQLLERQLDFEVDYVKELEDAIADLEEKVENWNSERNVELVKKLYAKSLAILDRYVSAYSDVLYRENRNKKTLVTPFFKELPAPM